MTVTPRLRLWIIAFLALGSMVPAGVSVAAAPSDAVVRSDARRVLRAAQARIGHALACVQTPAAKDDPNRRELHLLLTSSRARKEGRRIVERTRSADVGRVQIVGSRYRRQTLRRIYTRLRDTVPAEVGDGASIRFPNGPGYADDGPVCPRIYINVEERAPDSAREWARNAESRYGIDRIQIHLVRYDMPGVPSPSG